MQAHGRLFLRMGRSRSELAVSQSSEKLRTRTAAGGTIAYAPVSLLRRRDMGRGALGACGSVAEEPTAPPQWTIKITSKELPEFKLLKRRSI
jgi:hypothetical protein